MIARACRALLLPLLLPCPTARAGDPTADAIAALVRPRIDRGDAVGVVVGVVRDGKTEVFGFARPSVDDDQAPDGRTLFEIGSITKVFTSIALAGMAIEGLVRLDEPVAGLLPEGTRVPDKAGKPITLRTLANHTSGLPRVIPKVVALTLSAKGPYADVSAGDLYDFLRTAGLPRDPGAKYYYSNLGAGLLGTALARREGTTYEALIVGRIARPLGMDDTRIALAPSQRLRLARPYRKGGAPTIPWDFDAFAGAGALRSTADDMLRFARANLGLLSAPDGLVAAMAAARRPTADTGIAGLKIGLGWHISEANGAEHEVDWHNGGTGGFRSFLGIEPAGRLAVVVLANSDMEVDSIGMAALATIRRDRPHQDPARSSKALQTAPARCVSVRDE